MAEPDEPIASPREKRAKARATASHDPRHDESLVQRLRHEAEEAEEEATGDEVAPLGRWALLSRRAILIGLLPAFSIWYLAQAVTIPLPQRELLITPRAYPTVIGIAMLAIALLVAGLEIRKVVVARRAAGDTRTLTIEGTDDDDRERITNWKDAWVTLGALVLYVATFPFLGFFLSTAGFLIGVATYFAPRKWLRNIIVSLIFSVIVYLVFTQLLAVRLPVSPLGIF